MSLSIFWMLHSVFLGCLLSLSESTRTDLKNYFSKVRPGKLDGYVIKTSSNKGYRDCFNKCVRYATICGSFNYNKFTGLCELNSRAPDSATLDEVTTFVNSLVPSVQPNDPCSPHPCSPSELCVVLKSGAIGCVKECGIVGDNFVCNASYTKLDNNLGCLNGLWNQSLTLCAMQCTFEEPCLYLQQDINAGHFIKARGSTSSVGTGCTSDHTSGSGYYYYLEATGGTTADIFRMLTINPFPAGQQICVEFWYHMYGIEMGSLFIQLKDQSGYFSDILVANGSTGTEWHYWSTVIEPQPTVVWIAIEGVRGTGFKSDICVDDMMMYLC